MHKIIVSIIIICGWFIVNPTMNHAQEQDTTSLLSINLDTNIILIGDQIHLKLSSAIPKNMEVVFPEFKDSITQKIEIIEKLSPDTIQRKDGLLQITHDYIITSFDTGIHIIPPMHFKYVENNFDNLITSDSLAIYVLGMNIDTTKGIFDIKPPIDTPLSWKEIKPYVVILIIAILAIILIVLLILYIVSKRKNIPFFGRLKPKLPPHEEAFKQLELIKKKKLYQSGKIKQYYTEITDVLRIYLEGRLHIQTMERTSHEILIEVKNTDEFDTKHIKRIEHILYIADMVKFAKLKPISNESEQFFKDVYSLVEKTKYIETVENKEENPKNA